MPTVYIDSVAQTVAHEATHVQGGADDIDAALDARAIALANQGDIPYHAAAANTLAALAPGAAGEALLSGGAGANPTFGAPAPAAHAAEHEPAGGDPMTVDAVAGTGSLRTIGGGAQQAMAGNAAPAPGAHAGTHVPQTGGDPLTCAAPGAIDENASAEGVADYLARSDHNHQHTAALHENGGGAEISVAGLSGLLADRQTPLVNILVVAANDSLNKLAASYVCSGAADEVEIQVALDALPVTGGEVLLLDGTYHCAASIVLDSYQTLKGCGRNTILTASVADVDIITATGGAGTEKIGILIKDLCVDGDAGGQVNDIGIKWTYVDRSRIEGCWIRDNGEYGIELWHCDFNTISNNICQVNTASAIYLDGTGHGNSITGNICQGNTSHGIETYDAYDNTITGNTCQGNLNGIYIYNGLHTITGNTCQGNSNNGIWIDTCIGQTVTGNTCQGNTWYGIFLRRSDYCVITGNSSKDNTMDGIYLLGDGTHNSDYNTLTGNVCTGNGDDGIEIEGAGDANKNIVLGNQLLGNIGTALVDGGNNTEPAHNITV